MTTIQMVVLILLACCNHLLGHPSLHLTSLSFNRHSSYLSSQTYFEENVYDKTFTLSTPNKFDSEILSMKRIAKNATIHECWLNDIIDMAMTNRKFASELSFKFLPIGHSSVKKLLEKNDEKYFTVTYDTEVRINSKLVEYNNHAEEIRVNLTNLVKFNLFEQFSRENDFIRNLRALSRIYPLRDRRKECFERIKQIIDNTKKPDEKYIFNLITQYKTHFTSSSSFFVRFRRTSGYERDLNNFLYALMTDEYKFDWFNLQTAIKNLNENQKKCMDGILDKLRYERWMKEDMKNKLG